MKYTLLYLPGSASSRAGSRSGTATSRTSCTSSRTDSRATSTTPWKWQDHSLSPPHLGNETSDLHLHHAWKRHAQSCTETSLVFLMYLYAHPCLASPEGLSFISVMQRECCCINLVPRPSPTHDHRFNIQLRKVEWEAFDSLGTRLLLSHVHSIHYQAPDYVPGAGPTDGFLGPPLQERNSYYLCVNVLFRELKSANCESR